MMTIIVALLVVICIYQIVGARHLAGIHGNSIMMHQQIEEIKNEIKYTKSAIVDLRNDVQEIQDQLKDHKSGSSKA